MESYTTLRFHFSVSENSRKHWHGPNQVERCVSYNGNSFAHESFQTHVRGLHRSQTQTRFHACGYARLPTAICFL